MQETKSKKARFKYKWLPLGIKEKQNFKDSVCFVPISCIVANSSNLLRCEMEGRHFEGTIDLINKCNFKSCTILVVDTLSIHTLEIEYPDKTNDELMEIAYNNGTEWINRNRNAINKLTMPKEIVRWDNITEHKDYNIKYKQVSELYESDPEYKDAFISSAIEFFLRKVKRDFNSDVFEQIKLLQGKQQREAIERLYCKEYQRFLNSSIMYLKKEAAGMCVCNSDPFPKHRFEIYPSRRTSALESTLKKLINQKEQDVLNLLEIYF